MTIKKSTILQPQRAASARISGEFVAITVSQALAAVGGFVTVKLLTSRMTRSEYGGVGLALTAVTLTQLCIGGPLAQAAVRYYAPAKEAASVREYVWALGRLIYITTGWLSVIAILIFAVTLAFYPEWSGIIISSACLAIVYSISIALDGVQAGARKRVIVGVHQTATQWLRGFFPLLIFQLLGRTSTQIAILGYLGASLVVVASQLNQLRQLIRASERVYSAKISPAKITEYKAALLNYARPFASWGLIAWLQMATDRWFLDIFHGKASVGAFTACYQIGYYPSLLASTALSALFTPIMFEKAGDGQDLSRLRKADKLNHLQIIILSFATSLLCLILYLFRDKVFLLLASREYLPFSAELAWLACASGLFSIGQALSVFFLLRGQSGKLVWPKIATSTLGAGFNYVGARYWGVHGAAVSSALFGAVYVLTLGWLVRSQASAAKRFPNDLKVEYEI